MHLTGQYFCKYFLFDVNKIVKYQVQDKVVYWLQLLQYLEVIFSDYQI